MPQDNCPDNCPSIWRPRRKILRAYSKGGSLLPLDLLYDRFQRWCIRELVYVGSFVSQICDPPDPPICLWKNKTATLLLEVRGRDPRGGKLISLPSLQKIRFYFLPSLWQGWPQAGPVPINIYTIGLPRVCFVSPSVHLLIIIIVP